MTITSIYLYISAKAMTKTM